MIKTKEMMEAIIRNKRKERGKLKNMIYVYHISFDTLSRCSDIISILFNIYLMFLIRRLRILNYACNN